jgi:serine/threonine protein kinase
MKYTAPDGVKENCLDLSCLGLQGAEDEVNKTIEGSYNTGNPVQGKDIAILRPHFQDADHQSLDASEHDSRMLEGGAIEEYNRETYAVPPEKNRGKKDKRWVPRRKIRFQRLYACKTIATEKIKGEQLKELLNEIYFMRKMDHPYIIRLYEVYQVNSESFFD